MDNTSSEWWRDEDDVEDITKPILECYGFIRIIAMMCVTQ
jgi:hypothetical protein